MTEINDELLYGKAVADKRQAFDKAAQEIQDKHQAFFKETPSRFAKEGEDTPSNIHEFYTLQYDSSRASIGVEPTLPSDIDNELREAFKKAFG